TRPPTAGGRRNWSSRRTPALCPQWGEGNRGKGRKKGCNRYESQKFMFIENGRRGSGGRLVLVLRGCKHSDTNECDRQDQLPNQLPWQRGGGVGICGGRAGVGRGNRAVARRGRRPRGRPTGAGLEFLKPATGRDRPRDHDWPRRRYCV